MVIWCLGQGWEKEAMPQGQFVQSGVLGSVPVAAGDCIRVWCWRQYPQKDALQCVVMLGCRAMFLVAVGF